MRFHRSGEDASEAAREQKLAKQIYNGEANSPTTCLLGSPVSWCSDHALQIDSREQRCIAGIEFKSKSARFALEGGDNGIANVKVDTNEVNR